MPALARQRIDERLGKISFSTIFAGFNVGFFSMHLSALLGMRRDLPPAGSRGVNNTISPSFQ